MPATHIDPKRITSAAVRRLTFRVEPPAGCPHNPGMTIRTRFSA